MTVLKGGNKNGKIIVEEMTAERLVP